MPINGLRAIPMQAKRIQPGLYPAVGKTNLSEPSSFPGATWPVLSIPDLPVMADAVIRVELLLQAKAIDLASVTSVIAGDLGLTVQLLQLASRHYDLNHGFPRISDLLVHLGIEDLKSLIANATIVSEDRAAGEEMQAYLCHANKARITALIAQELVNEESQLGPEEAYLAGLTFRLGGIPRALGWQFPGAETMLTAELGHLLARIWGFPEMLAEVIHGECGQPTSALSASMRDLVALADEWAELVTPILPTERAGRVGRMAPRLEKPSIVLRAKA
jgi:HD-like signal output (HDOD) protein